MKHSSARPTDTPPTREVGDVIWFFKLHEDTAEQVGPPKRNERNENLYPFRVKAKERPGIVLCVDGELFLWMAGKAGRHEFKMIDGENVWADNRPQNFRTCPNRLVRRPKGKLTPIALESVLEIITAEAMGWRS